MPIEDHEEQSPIFKLQIEKVEGKGEVQWLFWKDKEIGEYTGAETPLPNLGQVST